MLDAETARADRAVSRAEALERALHGACDVCVKYETCKMKIIVPPCKYGSAWQFDEAAFAEGGEQSE
jgi:hypothetical protein